MSPVQQRRARADGDVSLDALVRILERDERPRLSGPVVHASEVLDEEL